MIYGYQIQQKPPVWQYFGAVDITIFNPVNLEYHW